MCESGDIGSRTPTATVVSAAISSGALGRLRVNGLRRVRMAKMINVCVARDSANHPARDVCRGVDADADVGRMQGQRIVDTVPEEPHRPAATPEHGDQPRLLLRADPGEDRRGLGRWEQVRVAHRGDLIPGEGAAGGQTEVGADLLGDQRIVARTHLHLDPERSQPPQRRRRGGFRPVEEHQEAGQRQIPLVGGGHRVEVGCDPAGHRDDPASGGELRLHGHRGCVRDRHTSREHGLGRAPLTTRSVSPVGVRTSAEVICRPWSNGR